MAGSPSGARPGEPGSPTGPPPEGPRPHAGPALERVGPDGGIGRWAGAVLCGGASRRMGRDKALIMLEGRPLAARAAEALAGAGALRVAAIGGDGAALAVAGLHPVPDAWPGAGPLGGLVTALRWARGVVAGLEAVMVVACDLVAPSAQAVEATVAALGHDPSADAAVPVVGSRRQWVHAAWRPRAEQPLVVQLDRGRRAIHAAVAGARLAVAEVEGLTPGALADADLPRDLPEHVAGDLPEDLADARAAHRPGDRPGTRPPEA